MLNLSFLNKVFYTGLVVYVLSSCQVSANPLFKQEGMRSDNCTAQGMGAYAPNMHYDEDRGYDHFADAIWLSAWAATAAPALEVDVTALDFGGSDASKSATITNSGGGSLLWSLSEDEEWITVDATSGILGASESKAVAVAVDRSKIVVTGVIEGTITITSNGGDAEIEVSMTVSGEPVLEVSPSALDFGSEYIVKELFVSNSGTGDLDWVVAANEEWITVDQGSGSTGAGKTDAVNVLVDRSVVTELGRYSDTLSVTSEGGDAEVSVVMEKINHPPEVPSVISPADGATGQSLYTTLSWEGDDIDIKDGDLLTSDVYFSANESLVDIEDVSVLVCADLKGTYCDPGTNSLEWNTDYYWKVVSKDSYGEIVTSRVWSFTTEEGLSSLCPSFALELGFEERRLLRELRDLVLARNKDGRNYINVYYHYSWELLLMLFMNNELRTDSINVFRELRPVIEGMLVDHEVFVPVKITKEIGELLEKIALYASPPLKTVLNRIKTDITNRNKMEMFGIMVTDE